MHKLKPISSLKLISLIEKMGYVKVRQKGSHATFVNKKGQIILTTQKKSQVLTPAFEISFPLIF